MNNKTKIEKQGKNINRIQDSFFLCDAPTVMFSSCFSPPSDPKHTLSLSLSNILFLSLKSLFQILILSEIPYSSSSSLLLNPSIHASTKRHSLYIPPHPLPQTGSLSFLHSPTHNQNSKKRKEDQELGCCCCCFNAILPENATPED